MDENHAVVFQCPRRSESHFGQSPVFARDNDYDPSDDTCRYCGSLNPVTFMARLEVGDVLLGSTDKNYKVYVENNGGEKFKQTYRDCYNAPDKDTNPCNGGPEKCTHWVTRETDHTKFYFPHLDEAQKRRFIEILNEKRFDLKAAFSSTCCPSSSQPRPNRSQIGL